MKHSPIQSLILQTFVTLLMILLLESISIHTVQAQTTPFLVTPYTGNALITQGWTSPFEPNHHAYDFGLNYQAVVAAEAGTVSVVKWNNNTCHNYSGLDQNIGLPCGFGLYIRINHSNGYSTIYGHLSTTAFALTTAGTTSVQAGQIIGTSGNTGWSTGPHLHFELRNNGNTTQIDPFSPNLWKDGEWANPSRPIPAPAYSGEIVVDDTTDSSSGFRKGSGGYPNSPCTGNCASWTGAATGFNNDRYYTTADRGTNSIDQWAEWTPSGIPSEGAVYEVFVYVPNANATSWQAPYWIRYLDTSGNWTNKATIVDQYGLNNQWVSIGVYRMKPGAYVYTYDATSETIGEHCGGGVWCELGVDAVKFVRRGTVYAPDARYNNGGWTTKVTIRNNGGGLATVLIKALQSNGIAACTTNIPTLFAHQSLTYSCPSTSVASFIIEADQDMSVVASQERSSPYTHEAYAGVDNPTSEVLVPIVQRNNSGWYSDLFIQNAGSTNTSVNLQFMGAAGGCILTPCTYTNQATIAPGARARLALSSYTVDGFYGAVRVTNSANQPLAVASTQYFDNGSVSLLMETSNRQPPASTLYAPLIQNNNSGWLSGLAFYRTGNGPFDLRYYNNTSGSECANAQSSNNPYNVYPAPPTGSPCPTTPLGKFQANSSMVANINQLKSGVAATTSAAIANPSRQVIVGKVWRDSANTGWSDAFMIANYNGVAAAVTVQFYNANGSVNTTQSYTVYALQSVNIFGSVPTNFFGSAVITSDQPIAVLANSYYPAGGLTTRDVIGSYPATHR